MALQLQKLHLVIQAREATISELRTELFSQKTEMQNALLDAYACQHDLAETNSLTGTLQGQSFDESKLKIFSPLFLDKEVSEATIEYKGKMYLRYGMFGIVANEENFALTVRPSTTRSFVRFSSMVGIPKELATHAYVQLWSTLTNEVDFSGYPKFKTKNGLTFYRTKSIFPYHTYEILLRDTASGQYYLVELGLQASGNVEDKVRIDKGIKEVMNSIRLPATVVECTQNSAC